MNRSIHFRVSDSGDPDSVKEFEKELELGLY